MDNEFTIIQQLLYDILFSDKTTFVLNLNKFCSYKQRTKFKDKIRNICKVGEITILDDRIIHTDEFVGWKIELQK